LIGLAIFAVIIWVIIIIAINKDLDSVSTTHRTDNVSLPSVSVNNKSNYTYTTSNKNFYNSEAAKYCCSKIVEGILEDIAERKTKSELEIIDYSYDFRVTMHCVKLCDEYHFYHIPNWKYDFNVHRYPSLTEHEDRKALAMAICNRVNAELKSKLSIGAKLTYSTERNDYERDPSFTVFIKYAVPNPNYVEMKSW
jgi:hypothetical protein